MLDRRSFLVAAGTVGVAGVAGCSAPTDSGEATTDDPTTTTTTTPGETLVEMTDDLKFVPRDVTIPVGGTVVWETVGAVAHSATAYEEDIPTDAEYFASGEFDSESAARTSYPDGSVGKGETYSHTFRTPGTYEYFCIPHEQAMQGTVVVE